MIRSLLLLNEKFDIQYVDLNKDCYKDFKKHEDALIYFQEHYHFDNAKMENLYSFKTFYPNLLNESETAELDFQVFLDEFLEKNKKIQQKFADAWMYKKVLSIKDPTRLEITDDLIDLVNYQTAIPKEKIRVIFDEAIQFKGKYKVDHILQHEGHINGPWETDEKGDIAFEDKLTLSLLAQKMRDPYSSDIKPAIKMFNKYALKARTAFDLADSLSDDLANDSYSFRQGILYERRIKTDMIKGIQKREKETILSDEPNVIKFKLGNDVLPQDSAVYAIPHMGKVITREDIEEDSKKLAFIMINEQIRSSLSNIPPMLKDTVLEILNSNNDKMLDFKKELSKKYRHVEYNRKDFQFKKLIGALLDSLSGKKLPKSSWDELGLEDIRAANQIVTTHIAKNGLVGDSDGVFEVEKYITTLMTEERKTKLEKALESKTSFISLDSFQEINFLNEIDISRRDPLKTLLDKHPDARIFNEYIKSCAANPYKLRPKM